MRSSAAQRTASPNRMSATLARRNLLLYLLQYGTRFLSPLVVAPFLAKTLGPLAFADYVLWNSAIWTAVLLMEFGFYVYAINATAKATTSDELSAAVSRILAAKLLLTPLALSGFVLGTLAMGLALRQPVAVAAGVVAVFFYGMTWGWYFQGLQKGITAIILEAVPQFTQLLLVLVVVLTPQDMWRVACLQTLAAIATTSFGWALIQRNHLRIKIVWASARTAIKEAVPYFVERASFTLYSTATPILILLLSNAHQAAFYGIAEKVNTLLTALVMAATPALTPVVARHVRDHPHDWRLSLKVVLAITGVTALGAVAAAIIVGPLMARFLGPEFQDAIPVARWFCVVAALMAFQLSVSNFIILQAGRASLLIRTSLIALVITLAMQALLVPAYGALGSTIARACGELAIGLILVASALRIVRKRSAS